MALHERNAPCDKVPGVTLKSVELATHMGLRSLAQSGMDSNLIFVPLNASAPVHSRFDDTPKATLRRLVHSKAPLTQINNTGWNGHGLNTRRIECLGADAFKLRCYTENNASSLTSKEAFNHMQGPNLVPSQPLQTGPLGNRYGARNSRKTLPILIYCSSVFSLMVAGAGSRRRRVIMTAATATAAMPATA